MDVLILLLATWTKFMLIMIQSSDMLILLGIKETISNVVSLVPLAVNQWYRLISGSMTERR